MNILDWLDNRSRKNHITISILFTLVLIFVDYWTGFEYRVKIFYLIPVSYAAWFIGKKAGIAFSACMGMTMLYSGIPSGTDYDAYSIEIWNMAMYFAFVIVMIVLLSKLRSTMQQREGLITKLQNALNAVEELSGILPICANCKKIRDDKGYWHDVDVYISRHTKVEFTHGICAECANKLYPSLFDKIEK